jgi:hypothetical protein
MTPRWPGRAVAAALLPLLILVGGCGGEKKQPPPVDIAVALAAAPHVVSVEERTTAQAGYRLLLLELEQPVDHAAPAGATFQQFASLLWNTEGEHPVVLATNGYDASRNPGRNELTALLDAHQLTVEHRYFDPSSPEPKDWSKLTVEQAAADHHLVVESLRPVLGHGAWLDVGASKGGMTAVYHRRFYPDDVDGTVAYVAPQSFSRTDPAYVDFLGAVGGAGQAGCRDALAAYQRTLLSRRAEVEPLLAAAALGAGDTFDTFGLAKAYDYSVVELSFAFWQYSGSSRCGAIPASGATAQALFDFMSTVLGGITNWIGDASLAFYAPYYFQSATQLGGPAYPQAHLLDLLPGGVEADDLPERYPPSGVTKTYDAAVMPAVDAWVSSSGERLLFVYGENDPWSSRPFDPDPAKDSHRYFVPAGNHNSTISRLPDADRAAATGILRRWAGLAPLALAAGETPEFDPWALLEGERGAPR